MPRKRNYCTDGSNFAKLKAILGQNGYSSKKEISAKLLEVYAKQRQQIEDEIVESEQKRLDNIEADKLNSYARDNSPRRQYRQNLEIRALHAKINFPEPLPVEKTARIVLKNGFVLEKILLGVKERA